MHYTLFLAALFAPIIAYAAPQSFRELVTDIVVVVNVATPMLVAAALAVFMYRGVLSFMAKGQGRESFAARFRQIAIWGILILFVMVSIWGILAILEETFLSNDPGSLSPTSNNDPFSGCNTLDGSGC